MVWIWKMNQKSIFLNDVNASALDHPFTQIHTVCVWLSSKEKYVAGLLVQVREDPARYPASQDQVHDPAITGYLASAEFTSRAGVRKVKLTNEIHNPSD